MQAEPSSAVTPETPVSPNPGNVIRSEGAITVENGVVTYGAPKLTEDVEKQIYKTLSYYHNLASEIEANVPGGNRGSQQTRQDYELSKKSFMVRYQLSDADIGAILRKGDEQGWDSGRP